MDSREALYLALQELGVRGRLASRRRIEERTGAGKRLGIIELDLAPLVVVRSEGSLVLRVVGRLFGADDIDAKRRQATIERSMLSYAAFSIRTIPSSEPLPRRLRRLISLGLRGREEHRAIEQLRCERGASIARKAGFEVVAGTPDQLSARIKAEIPAVRELVAKAGIPLQ